MDTQNPCWTLHQQEALGEFLKIKCQVQENPYFICKPNLRLPFLTAQLNVLFGFLLSGLGSETFFVF